MAHVYVSYSRRDTERIDPIVEAVAASGIEVWIDRTDIKAEQNWRVQIVQAIHTCDAFILMLSPNSTASNNIRRELDFAQDLERPIFPILLEPVTLPPEMRYPLAGLQFIDLHQLGFEAGLKQLLGALNDVLLNRGG